MWSAGRGRAPCYTRYDALPPGAASMSDLQRNLASLHDALRGAQHLDADERAMLETVLADIRRVLEGSSLQDASGSEHGDALEGAAVRLEAGHPGLAGAIRSVLDALGKAGI